MTKSQRSFDAVTAQYPESRRCGCGRHCRAGAPSRPLGLCRLPGSPDQVRGRQHARRAVRHRRPHRHRGTRAIDRQDIHHRQSRRRRRQYRHGICRACRSGRLHDPARDQCRFGEFGLYNTLPFDPVKDFVGVSELATSPNTFVVKSDSAGEDDEGFCRARPRQPRQLQLRHAAHRHDGAAPARASRRSVKICRNSRTSCSRAAATPLRRCSAVPRN